MSRIGKKPIDIPETVSVTVDEQTINIKGKYGSLKQSFSNSLQVKVDKNILSLTRLEDTKLARSSHGLIRALIQNMILGVTKKFSKVLIAEGVGYKFQLDKQQLIVNVGFTHPVKFPIPSDIEIKLESPVKILISGIDKERVGFFADKVRSIKPPEPYKGKGILYEGEIIRRKIGKRGK
jgi:large subunit ribosomal protein L6